MLRKRPQAKTKVASGGAPRRTRARALFDRRIFGKPVAHRGLHDLKAGVIPGWVSPAPSSPAPAKEPTETTHISVIDAEGNAASLTQTVNYAFGACVVVPGYDLCPGTPERAVTIPMIARQMVQALAWTWRHIAAHGPSALPQLFHTGAQRHSCRVPQLRAVTLGHAYASVVEAAYKQMLVDSTVEDLLVSDRLTGTPASWLKPSMRQRGLDPDALPEAPSRMRATRSSSMQPPDTEPLMRPSPASTAHEPTGRGAVPQVRATLTSHNRSPCAAQASASCNTC